VRIRILDGSVHAQSPTLGSQLIVALGEVKIATNLMPDIPRSLATVEMIDVRALVVDSVRDVQEGTGEAATGVQYWKVSRIQPSRIRRELRERNSRRVLCSCWNLSGWRFRSDRVMDSSCLISRYVLPFVLPRRH
jgi:hypothetical protein